MVDDRRDLDGRFLLTCCMDGHVSIIDKTEKKRKQRRLGSALPLFAVDDILDAFELIRRLCVLTRVHHGGKTGTLIEPMVLGWPTRRDPTLDDLDAASRAFKAEWVKMTMAPITQVGAEEALGNHG